MGEEKTAAEVMSEALQHPTLDAFLDRNPKTLTREDYVQLVDTLRKQRAIYIAAKRERKDKKELK